MVHKDVRVANMLFNPETNGIMMIDFERSSLTQLVRNKRAWKQTTTDGRKATGDSHDRTRSSGEPPEDIWRAKMAFLDGKTHSEIWVIRV